MHILHETKDCPEHARHSVLALGNFDGVHRGHQAILQYTIDTAKKNGSPSAVMTFCPHPLTVLRPDIPALNIMSFNQKAQTLERLGIDVLFALPFTLDFSRITAEDFIRMILVEQLQVRHLVIGHDFIFGHQRGGNADLLRAMAEECGYRLTQLSTIAEGEEVFSSTRIRQYLTEGNIEQATRLLGHPYIIEGMVEQGKQRGRELGFPTANIHLSNYLHPKFGIYAAEVCIEGEEQWHKAAINIGINPSFDDVKPLLEVHILDVSQDLYSKKLQVKPLHYLRPEQVFDDMDALKAQMQKDCDQVQEYFAKMH